MQLSIARRGAAVAQSRLARRLRAALRAGQRRAARDRLRLAEPRRCAHEPRQPEPREQPGQGRPAAAESGATQHSRARSMRSAARRQSLAVATAQAERTATAARADAGRTQRVHRLARVAAAARRSSRSPPLVAQAQAAQVRSGQLGRAPAAAATVSTTDCGDADVSVTRPERSRSARPATRSADAPRAASRSAGASSRSIPSVIPLGTHMHDSRLRRGRRRRHRRLGRRRDDRPLVPDRRAGERLGPPHGHDRPPLATHPGTLAARSVAQVGRAERPSEHPRARHTARPARRRPRPVPHGPAQPARGAERAGRRRGDNGTDALAPSASSRRTSS